MLGPSLVCLLLSILPASSQLPPVTLPPPSPASLPPPSPASLPPPSPASLPPPSPVSQQPALLSYAPFLPTSLPPTLNTFSEAQKEAVARQVGKFQADWTAAFLSRLAGLATVGRFRRQAGPVAITSDQVLSLGRLIGALKAETVAAFFGRIGSIMSRVRRKRQATGPGEDFASTISAMVGEGRRRRRRGIRFHLGGSLRHDSGNHVGRQAGDYGHDNYGSWRRVKDHQGRRGHHGHHDHHDNHGHHNYLDRGYHHGGRYNQW